jgi:hypothetical protein
VSWQLYDAWNLTGSTCLFNAVKRVNTLNSKIMQRDKSLPEFLAPGGKLRGSVGFDIDSSAAGEFARGTS